MLSELIKILFFDSKETTIKYIKYENVFTWKGQNTKLWVFHFKTSKMIKIIWLTEKKIDSVKIMILVMNL